MSELKQKPKVLIIAGPTAVGKTSFSLLCSEKFNGEIISADSIQIYKKMDIGSAKATPEERLRAVHHLIDFVEPDKNFSVSEFSAMSREKIYEVTSRGKLPIVVGGTGLFIKSLLYPMSFGGTDRDESIRKKWENFLSENGKDALHKELEKVDYESSQNIDKNNTRRVIRALEIYELTGKKKSEQNDFELESDFDYKLLFLIKDREKLYHDIDRRVDIMFECGLENEVTDLINKYKLTRLSQSMQAIGYKEFFDYIEGRKSIEEVKDEIKKASRHYAKRQITFFRHMKNAEIIDSNDILANMEKIGRWLNND